VRGWSKCRSKSRASQRKVKAKTQLNGFVYFYKTMNLIQDGEVDSDLLFINFNQDSTSLLVGTRSGYKVISFTSPEDIKLCDIVTHEEIFILERCFLSSLMALVSLSSPRKLRIVHFNKNVQVTTPRCYDNSILAVKLNRKRIIVLLEETIYIHDAASDNFMQDLYRINQTTPNLNRLCALSPANASVFAYPGSNSTGEVIIYDTLNLRYKIAINAHDNPLAALAFNFDGEMLATASEKGTIIRVHNVADGSLIHEFRRGFTRCVDIHSLSFSRNSNFLCASSNTETVHIFKIEDPSSSRSSEESASWINYLGKASETYLPTNISRVLNQWRSFAICKLPLKNLKTVCAITEMEEKMRVLVATGDGYLYIYDFNVNEGGECNLLKQHQIDQIPIHPVDSKGLAG